MDHKDSDVFIHPIFTMTPFSFLFCLLMNPLPADDWSRRSSFGISMDAEKHDNRFSRLQPKELPMVTFFHLARLSEPMKRIQVLPCRQSNRMPVKIVIKPFSVNVSSL
jgi:hypothetical protein